MSRVNSFSIFATIFASITIICVIGAVIVSTRRGKPAESEKPPSNLQQPQENSVSRIENVTTTKQLSETSTTVNTLAHSQVTTKLSSTESQPKKPNSLTTKQTPLMIAFEIIGSATACVSCLLCCRRKLRSRRKKRASGNSYELAST